MRRTHLTVPLAAAVVALTLTACGGVDAVTPEGVAATDSAAEDARPADILELTELMQEAQSAQETVHVEMTYTGGAAGVDLSSMSQAADMRFGATPAETDMAMSMDVLGSSMELVLVDGSMYMNAGALTGDDTMWFGGTLEEILSDPSLGGTADLAEQLDMVAQAESLAEAVTSFEHSGEEVVDGQDVDVYTVVIDPALLSDAVLPGGTGELGTLDEMVAVYRVTADGLLVTADSTIVMGGEEIVATLTYSQWGEPVDIEAPPADQVTPWAEIMG